MNATKNRRRCHHHHHHHHHPLSIEKPTAKLQLLTTSNLSTVTSNVRHVAMSIMVDLQRILWINLKYIVV